MIAMATTQAAYEPRERFFAHRLTRLLFKSCAAQSIGQDAVLLIIHIAHTEDAARYQGPVRFWNSQLNEVLGFRSPKSLNNARAKAIEAGWLVYERKNDRADGRYWTKIPAHVSEFNDEPIEPYQSIPESVPESVPSTESIPSTEQKAEREGYALRNGKEKHDDPPPNPIPIPKREARAKFVPPEKEELRAYWTEASLKDDPEAFFDHYESNGWRVGKNPMTDWRATARGWSRKSTSFGKPSEVVATVDAAEQTRRSLAKREEQRMAPPRNRPLPEAVQA